MVRTRVSWMVLGSLEDSGPVCLSGGASGADTVFGAAASAAGHDVIHYSFERHSTHDKASGRYFILNVGQLEAADPFLIRAAETLGRNPSPRSLHTRNLLRRNFYQQVSAQSIYAISSLDSKGYVEGGTAWAVQMFLDRHEGRACACYLFDQVLGRWLAWNGEWTPLTVPPPTPKDAYAGIGRRDLLPAGRRAIQALYA